MCWRSVLLSRTAWDNNFWLQVDYLQLASAALNVSSYFTCLLYIEVWAEITRFVVAVSADLYLPRLFLDDVAVTSNPRD